MPIRYPSLSVLFLFCFCLGAPMAAQTLLRNIGQDSLAGTTELGSSNPEAFVTLNDSQFVFKAISSPFEPGNLFVSNGTEAGTRQISGFIVDGQLVHYRDRVYFNGTGISTPVRIGLWATDGTEAGTELVFESNPAVDTLPVDPGNFFVLDTLLLFSGLTATHGTELWRTDGTAAGTSLLADITPGPTDGFRGGEPAVIDDLFYFTGFTPGTGLEPWQTDGTPEGTRIIADLNPGAADSGAADYTESGGFIYFTGLTESSGREVRRMVAGQATIELIGEGDGSTDSSDPRYFVDADGTLFYVAEAEGADGLELMRYHHVGEPEVMGPTDIFPQILKPFGNGQIVFKARDANGTELWISDGTTTGTRPITDLYPGSNDGIFPNVSAESFHVFKDSLVYYAGSDGVVADGEFVYELFVTDGTAAGTELVSDQMPGTAGSNPGNFFTFKNNLYFAATDALVGREPFHLGPAEPPVSIFQPTINSLGLKARVVPNPASISKPLRVEIKLDRPLKLTARLYDIKGELVSNLSLPQEHLQAGLHALQWQLPVGISPGLYFIRLVGKGGIVSLRMVVVD